MKWLWPVVLALIFLVTIKMALLGQESQQQRASSSLVDGHLRPCPDPPNCVCSELHTDTAHIIAPLQSHNWQQLVAVITRQGGKVIRDNGQYLHATFTSSLFHFVDDLEARLDRTEKVIHLRSASRVGHSDLGVNRKRVEHIRQQMMASQ